MSAILDLVINQGSSFTNEITVNQDDNTALDLTGYSIKSEIRKTFRSVSATATFSTDIFDAVNGKIRLNLTSTQTSAIKAGRYKYDVEITSQGSEDGIGSISVDTGGTGYTTAPITFSGGSGTGATATASINNGVITSISVDTPGSGYISDPSVSVGGDGTGATATANRGGKKTRVVEGTITISPEVTKI